MGARRAPGHRDHAFDRRAAARRGERHRKPIAFILTLPVTILTLGLFLFVLNAAMVALVAWMLPGFHVDGFKAALLTAIIVWIVSWIGSWFIGKRSK